MSYDSVMFSSDMQTCADSFYKIVTDSFDRFYPEKTITLSDKDPHFVTREIKLLLKTKNQLFRDGKVTVASSTSGQDRSMYCNVQLNSSQPHKYHH